jgi:hypothetical protein
MVIMVILVPILGGEKHLKIRPQVTIGWVIGKVLINRVHPLPPNCTTTGFFLQTQQETQLTSPFKEKAKCDEDFGTDVVLSTKRLSMPGLCPMGTILFKRSY